MHDETPPACCPSCGQRPKHVRVGGSVAVVCACKARVIRRRSWVLPVSAVAAVASVIACGAPGGGEPRPLLGPYAMARTGVASPIRADGPSTQDARAGAAMLRETRRTCDLRGGKGSC
jgi:hypothetical protein